MKKAFTLTEVLITLAIIGVISTLTLPGMMQNYKNKVQIAQLQKAYNQIANAAAQLMTDEEADDMSQTSLTTVDGVGEFLNKYFNVQEDCGTTTSGCFADNYQTYDRSQSKTPSQLWGIANSQCVTIDSGAAICVSTYVPNYNHAEVFLDTNGMDGPNLNGLDLFRFKIYRQGRLGVVDRASALSKDKSYVSNETK